jgi:PAS domain S-box-containing protein
MHAPTPDDEPLTRAAEAAEAILLIESTPLPLAVILPDGHVALANRALREYLGYRPADLAGADVKSLLDPDFVDDFPAHWEHILSVEGVTKERVARLRRRDGGYVEARIASLVVADDEGAPRFLIARALAA